MKHALSLPPLGALADPSTMVQVAVAAEAAGWDGLFVWDHVLRRPTEPPEIADPWIMLAAIASATSSVRIGPMVTPITRRRPIKVAREAITLDQLSNGRLTLGMGLGVDTYGELSRFGEITDPKIRGQRLDEGVELLCSFWTGEKVDFKGRHFVAEGVTVRPLPLQQPRIPLWFAARGSARKPVRRAARYDGLFPIEVDPPGLRDMLETVRSVRGSLEGFDVALHPTNRGQYEAFGEIGMTWAINNPRPGLPIAEVLSLASTSPAETF